MKVKKRQIVFWIAAVLAVCLYLYGRYRMQGLEERMRTISFVKTGEGSLLLPQNKKYAGSLLDRIGRQADTE